VQQNGNLAPNWIISRDWFRVLNLGLETGAYLYHQLRRTCRNAKPPDGQRPDTTQLPQPHVTPTQMLKFWATLTPPPTPSAFCWCTAVASKPGALLLRANLVHWFRTREDEKKTLTAGALLKQKRTSCPEAPQLFRGPRAAPLRQGPSCQALR
jgi:hypothetical protein